MLKPLTIAVIILLTGAIASNGFLGNMAAVSATGTNPSISITSPTNGAIVPGGILVITGTSSDGVGIVKSVQVKINQGSIMLATPKVAGDWSTWTLSHSFSNSGSYTIAARIIDKAGNVSTVSVVTITVDATPPTISITIPANNAPVNGNTPTVQGTASDLGSGVQQVQVSIDGGAYNLAAGTTSWSYTPSTLSSGSHTIIAKVTDNAGNVATTPTVKFTINSSTSSNVIFDFLVRSQGIPDSQLATLYAKHSHPSDIVTEFSDQTLSTTITSQVAGQKSVSYFSLADLQVNANNLHSLGYTWIAYDLEGSYSPMNEVNDPITSIQQASQIAHSNGLKLLISPAGISQNDYAAMAPYTDGWVMQSMIMIGGDPTVMSNKVHSIVSSIKSGNPNEIVILQVSVNKDTVDQMNNAWDLTKDVVNGITIFYSNSTQIPAMAQILTHVDGIS